MARYLAQLVDDLARLITFELKLQLVCYNELARAARELNEPVMQHNCMPRGGNGLWP